MEKVMLELKETNDLNARIVKTTTGFRLDLAIDSGPDGVQWELGSETIGHHPYAYGILLLRLSEAIGHNGKLICEGQMEVEVA